MIAGGVRIEPGLGLQRLDRLLARLVLDALRILQAEADAVHLVGAGADHRVQDGPQPGEIVDGHRHLV